MMGKTRKGRANRMQTSRLSLIGSAAKPGKKRRERGNNDRRASNPQTPTLRFTLFLLTYFLGPTLASRAANSWAQQAPSSLLKKAAALQCP